MSYNSHLYTTKTIQKWGQLLLPLALLLVGCAQKPYFDQSAPSVNDPRVAAKDQSMNRFKVAYLADQIDSYYKGSSNGPLGVTTFVNLDDLYATSTFGRVMGEMMMGEMARKGFDVVELRHSDALQILDSGGEFALSRDIRSVHHAQELSGIVVGTYVDSPLRIYVNARLIDPSNSMVLAAASTEMDKTREMVKLLRGGVMPASLERIPVRHLGPSEYPLNLFPQLNSRADPEESFDTPPPPPNFYKRSDFDLSKEKQQTSKLETPPKPENVTRAAPEPQEVPAK